MAIKHTFDSKEGLETRVITKAKAIRFKCLECCSFVQSDVLKCTCSTCALYPFRFGNEKGLQQIFKPEDFDGNGRLIGVEDQDGICSMQDCVNYDEESEDDQFCTSCKKEGRDIVDEDEDEIDWKDDDE